MTLEEIIEGNKLICEFISGKVILSHEVKGFKTYAWIGEDVNKFRILSLMPKSDMHSVLVEHCCFHSSWDWLMPVVEKMYHIGYTVDINSGNRRMWVHRNDNGLMAGLPEYNEEFRGNKSYARDLTPVGCLFTAVVDLLKHYNENKN